MSLLQLRLQSDAEFLKIDFIGQLTREGWPLGFDPFNEHCGEGVYTSKVLVNLSQLNYVDSSGLSWLVASNKRFQNAGGALILHSASSLTRRFLELARLGKVLQLAADEPAARRLAAEALSA
jgi:anti-anti-sigma factor